MPPPRPKEPAASSTKLTNVNTPMSERQQMALLIQMTATSSADATRNYSKKYDEKYKRSETDPEDNNSNEKAPEISEATEDNSSPETKKEIKKETHIDESIGSAKNGTKRTISGFESNADDGVEDDNADAEDENKKRRKKETDAKDNKTVLNAKQQSRSVKTSTVSHRPATNEVADILGIPAIESETQLDITEEQKSQDMSCESLKVPPLKIVIPQQACSIDTEGNVLRTGKVAASRNIALPYVVSSSCEANEKESTSLTVNSPNEAVPKVCITPVHIVDEKVAKLAVEEKNLRILRSSHRSIVGGVERTSNNSSPHLQSSSPSPSSTCNTVEPSESKPTTISNSAPSPTPQNLHFDQESVNVPSPSASSTSSSKEHPTSSADLHPRKRKIRTKNDESNIKNSHNTVISEANSTAAANNMNDNLLTNGFQMYLNIRKQIEKKWCVLYPIKPRPPQCFNDYLLTKRTYLLSNTDQTQEIAIPNTIPKAMREVFLKQEKQRRDLGQRHTVEREKLCLNVEQEILRVHSKAARNISGQSAPFSVCTFLRDDEVYNLLSTDQDEKEKNARSRFNGRLLLSWLQDVDDKWEKIKESMILRHHNEAESLHAVQQMDWEIAAKKHHLCDYSSESRIDFEEVPIVYVGEDFDLLPA